MHLKSFSLALLFLSGIHAGCDKDKLPSCDEGDITPLETFYVEEFSNTRCSWDSFPKTSDELGFTEFNTVIDNQADYSAYFSCMNSGDRPEVDFDDFIILAGEKQFPNGATIASQRVFICTNKLIYQVRVRLGLTRIAQVLPYFVVIERPERKRDILFDIQVEE